MNKKTKIIRVILLSISLILLLNIAACTKKNDSSSSTSKETDKQENADNNTDDSEDPGDSEDKDSKLSDSDQTQDDTRQVNKNVKDTSIDLMADVKAQDVQPDNDLQKADFMQKFSVEML